MDEETKLVPVYTVGKRTEETTWYFINDLAERLQGASDLISVLDKPQQARTQDFLHRVLHPL